MYFLQESFLRLEAFLRPCGAYTRRWDTGLAVVWGYSALFTYVYFGLYTVKHRQLDLFALASGLGFAGTLLWLVGDWLPAVTNARAECALDADSGGRPADEALITVYVAVYFLLREAAFPGRAGRLWTAARLGATATYLVLSLWAPLHLRVQTTVSLVAGATFGLAGAVLAVAVLCWCHALRDHRRVEGCMAWLKLLPMDDPADEQQPLLVPQAESP